MRQRGEWMRPADDAILEAFDSYGNLTPQAIGRAGVTASGYAGERCKELTRYGMLERLSRGLYRLTDTGEAWLDGEIDADELEPEDDRLDPVLGE